MQPRRIDGVENSAQKIWWLYLLACTDGRTYVGIALDIEARFQAHLNGKGARFTRANPPLRILGAESFATRSAALKAEYALKQLNREQRLAWARSQPPRETTLVSTQPQP